jgi:hypothetical protein
MASSATKFIMNVLKMGQVVNCQDASHQHTNKPILYAYISLKNYENSLKIDHL